MGSAWDVPQKMPGSSFDEVCLRWFLLLFAKDINIHDLVLFFDAFLADERKANANFELPGSPGWGVVGCCCCCCCCCCCVVVVVVVVPNQVLVATNQLRGIGIQPLKPVEGYEFQSGFNHPLSKPHLTAVKHPPFNQPHSIRLSPPSPNDHLGIIRIITWAFCRSLLLVTDSQRGKQRNKPTGTGTPTSPKPFFSDPPT